MPIALAAGIYLSSAKSVEPEPVKPIPPRKELSDTIQDAKSDISGTVDITAPILSEPDIVTQDVGYWP